MSLAAAPAMPSFETVKMEDRKRPAMEDSHTAPPSKRQAVTVNGGSSHPDADMPWREEIEKWQKDAIARRMREYKRDAQIVKEQLKNVSDRSAYHDRHLTLIDAWFSQLLDEILLLCNEVPTRDHSASFSPFDSSLFTADERAFEQHLAQKSAQIKSAISHIFTKSGGAQPDAAQLQTRLAKLLADEKMHATELLRLNTEKEQLSERLENASMRYMVAEKKMDRMRSSAVAKLEAQAMSAPKSLTEEEESKPDGTAMVNGVSEENLQGIEAAKKQAEAAKSKMADQLEKLSEENQRLTEQLTTAQIKASSISEEDFANSELFKGFKSQHDDVVQRVNDLQATHLQLRAELKTLQAERTSYKEQVDAELRDSIIESETQAARTESDLARIRQARDDALAEISVLKANENTETATVQQKAEFDLAKDSRIAALESEVARLRQDMTTDTAEKSDDVGDLDLASLQLKLKTFEKEKIMMSKELTSMEMAYKKASAATSKKLAGAVDAEERLSRANAEKIKADQKYFATRKANDAQQAEIRTMKTQVAKTSEIISQLKEAENNCRSLLTQLEKQLADAKDSLAALNSTHRDLQQKSAIQEAQLERFKTTNAELQKALQAKDASVHVALQTHRASEVEAQELKVQLQETQKSLESWRKKGVGDQSEEFEMLKSIATCAVCRKEFKDTALKTCGHVFCQRCVEQRVADRARKCPNCNKAFGSNDLLHVTL